VMLLKRFDQRVPDGMAGSPAMEEDQGQTAARDAQVDAFAVISDKGLHSVQHLLPPAALLEFLAAAAGTGCVAADLGFLAPDG
jgi:hypothetical protein